MLNAFCRVAPSVRFRVLAILPAGLFFFASVFRVRTCSVVHARRLDFLAIKITLVSNERVSNCSIRRSKAYIVDYQLRKIRVVLECRTGNNTGGDLILLAGNLPK
jgi:hypothetical protein